MTIYSLDILLSWFAISLLFHEQFCCFWTCIQMSQEAGQVIWYSHLYKYFPQFVVIHTVDQGCGIVNKAKVDVFLELSCFFDDLADFGNLIFGSSVFSKSSSPIWKVMIHVLLKPGLENVEHYFARMWDEWNCATPPWSLQNIHRTGKQTLGGNKQNPGPRRKEQWPHKLSFSL